MNENKTYRNLGIIGGLFLIGLGLLFLIGQVLRFDVWHYLWPLIVVGIGLLFFGRMVTRGKSAGRLAIPGSIIVMVGLVMLVQNTFDYWKSWAFCWTLIPVAYGIGMVINGYWSESEDSRRMGWRLVRVGMLFFLLFGVFFVLSDLTRNTKIASILLPLALILAGIFIILGQVLGWFKTTPSTPPVVTPASPEAVTPVENAAKASDTASSDQA
jgi:hypothetical protein